MRYRAADLGILVAGLIATGTVSYAQEVTEDMRKACLPAADYEGCIRSFVNPPSTREEYDFLGLPKIKEWKMVEDRPGNFVYYVNYGVAKVKVRSAFGRYIAYEYVVRWNQQATPGRSGHTAIVGSATTNCYGTGYGSVNCTTTPAPTITIPGRAGTPGGIMQERVVMLIDCLERSEQRNLVGKWEAIGEDNYSATFANEWCNKIAELPESEIKNYASGSPNSNDILAFKVLPGSDPESIRRNYASKQ